MEWITHLNSSEKKQLAVIGIVLSLVIGLIVIIFINLADRQQITMDDALETAGDARKIENLAIDLGRMGTTYDSSGQEISQREIQNPIDGGFGDDGSFKSSVAEVSKSVNEVARINQSVDLSNGIPASEYLSGRAAPQPVAQAPIDYAPQQEPTAELQSVEPSVPASQ